MAIGSGDIAKYHARQKRGRGVLSFADLSWAGPGFGQDIGRSKRMATVVPPWKVALSAVVSRAPRDSDVWFARVRLGRMANLRRAGCPNGFLPLFCK